MIPFTYNIKDYGGVLPKDMQECAAMFRLHLHRGSVVCIFDGDVKYIYTWTHIEKMDKASAVIKVAEANAAETDIAKLRGNTCITCPYFDSSSTLCRACGCYMRYKWPLKDQTCPQNKW